MKRIFVIIFFTFLSIFSYAQVIVKGPYTVSILDKGIYHIEDANPNNPAGVVTDKDGNTVHRNIASDMYLVVGGRKALLVDLSNNVKWDSTATESLRSIVYERTGSKRLYITVTHKHGDHLGMLHAFKDDNEASFWISEGEFKGMDIFPKERTTFFAENASFDLGGGYIINTLEVPGHSDHSTLFILNDRNIIFSGDAIGSGDGVLIFNYESIFSFRKGLDNLIAYIKNPANHINPQKLIIYGGHFYQKGNLDKLTSQYIYDMRTLIDKIAEGKAETEISAKQAFAFLDTHFKYAGAKITWNKEAAAKFAAASAIGK